MNDPPPLPAGTVTLLFTDIEGSTRLLQQLGSRYPALLADHHRLLRAAVQEWGGSEIDTAGDGFFVSFPRAGDALAATLAAQQALAAHSWPEGVSPRVRMGLHTGEPLRTETGYVGVDVHRAARLAAAGHGGQILLSQATYELVRDGPPPGCSLRDLGSHRLKDLQRPEQVYQLLHPDLPADFPPLRGLDAFPHNLPLQVTRFIGRETEMATVKELLGKAVGCQPSAVSGDKPAAADSRQPTADGSRLLTLTGSGGCGKTRLALQVAADLVEEYPDGVWLIELAALTDPTLVVQAVASALRVREEPGRPLLGTLIDTLRPKQLLLLLDNCEHLVQACAELAAALLRECSGAKILTTSREALGIAGETVWRVPSLSLPEAQARLTAERLSQYEAVRLFLDRARSSQPTFEITEENAAWIAEICSRLDGIPLAIELAAARVKVLAPAQIAVRLVDRFQLLTGGSRAALPRQQTLQAAMDWSYELLSEPERLLLRRLAVFAGGFSLAAAEAVCARPGLEARQVFALLGQLADKSLLAIEQTAQGVPTSEARYRLLETVRQYAAERLQEAGEGPLLRGRHRDFFLALAEQAEPELEGPRQMEWLARLEAEHENMRAALRWSTERARAEGRRWLGRWAQRWWLPDTLRTILLGWALRDELVAGLRLGAALVPFWLVRGYWAEAREQLTELLSLARALPSVPEDARRLAVSVRRRVGIQYLSAQSLWLTGWSGATLLAVAVTFARRGQWILALPLLLMVLWAFLGLGLRAWYGSHPVPVERLSTRRFSVPKSAGALRPDWWLRGTVWVAPAWLQRLGSLGCSVVLGVLLCGLLLLLWFAMLEVLTTHGRSLVNDRSSWLALPILVALLFAGVWALSLMLSQPLATIGALRIEALAQALHGMGRIADAQGQDGATLACYYKTLTLYEALGSARNVARLLSDLATIALRQRDAAWAQAFYEMILRIWLKRGDRHGVALALSNLGSVLSQEGNVEGAQSLLQDSLQIRQELGDQQGIAVSLSGLGKIAMSQGRLEEAWSLYQESLTIRHALGDKGGIAECLEGLAAVAVVQARAEVAAGLFGAATALREELGAPLPPAEQSDHERQAADLRVALGEERFAAAWAAGRAMPLEQSIARALEEPPGD